MSRHALLGRSLALVLPLLGVLALLGPSPAETGKGKKYALVVGVRTYDSDRLASLKYTENDAEELANVLAKEIGFSVVILTSTRGEKVKAAAPTSANLRAALKRFMGSKTRKDTLLVALSGHGLSGKVTEGGKEKDESFFCPSDAQINDSKTLLALGKLLADLDASGAGIKLLLVDADRNDPTAGRNVDVDTMPRLPHGMGALFGCKSGERAFETPKLGKGHGVFSYYVLNGLKGEAQARRGEVTWNSLCDYVSEKVSHEVPKLIGSGARQTPHAISNFSGGSPVLVEAKAKK